MEVDDADVYAGRSEELGREVGEERASCAGGWSCGGRCWWLVAEETERVILDVKSVEMM